MHNRYSVKHFQYQWFQFVRQCFDCFLIFVLINFTSDNQATYCLSIGDIFYYDNSSPLGIIIPVPQVIQLYLVIVHVSLVVERLQCP